ncbi:hypothetical protein ACFQE1_00345 [Halobium palmae]|uniref:Uncharacterized protein n=1 Tax=Halobium palmae TaxID=1776492 RepID=A0ABD5RUD0_9EURY
MEAQILRLSVHSVLKIRWCIGSVWSVARKIPSYDVPISEARERQIWDPSTISTHFVERSVIEVRGDLDQLYQSQAPIYGGDVMCSYRYELYSGGEIMLVQYCDGSQEMQYRDSSSVWPWEVLDPEEVDLDPL